MAGLLGDIYSYGDTLKRKVNGLLADPRGTLEQFVGQLGDQANQTSDLMNQAGWMPIAKTNATKEQQAMARALLAEQGTNAAMAGATVWHGSPHKFDKFDSSKIGTGEGAQAYGHGLYLAEHPAVAEQYKDALSRYDVPMDGPVQFAHNVLQSTKYADRTEGMLRRSYPDLADDQIAATIQQAKDALSKGKNGQLYKVDLPDEHIAKMMDWDAPIGRQNPEVLSAFNNSQLGKTISGAFSAAGIPGRMNSTTFGNALKMIKDGTGPEAAAQLKAAGIPGIRYLDGGSRTGGAGTSNYVVFPGNESLLKVQERNGEPLGLLK